MSRRRGAARVGICKLCGGSRRLQRSHLVPRSVYALCRAPEGQNPNPIMVTDEFAMQTSRQWQDYLLCFDCEQLLRRKGEDWVVSRLASYDRPFPLATALSKLRPHISEPDVTAYLLNQPTDVNTGAIIHFAMGIFWKASVHSWSGSRRKTWIDLGTYREAIRKYLLDGAELPADVVLTTFLLPSPVKLITFHLPFEILVEEARAFQFYVPGVQYMLWLGPDIPESVKRASITFKPNRTIVVTDFSEVVIRRFREAYSTANKSAAFLESFPEV